MNRTTSALIGGMLGILIGLVGSTIFGFALLSPVTLTLLVIPTLGGAALGAALISDNPDEVPDKAPTEEMEQIDK